jgi:transposase InsO family protein
MASALPNFPAFNVREDGSVSVRWARWKERLDNLLVALDVTTFKRQKALLLHYAGDEVHDIFSTLELTACVAVNDEEPDVYKQATDALEAYFVPKRNKEFDIYKFRQAKQDQGENIMTYCTRLRKLAEHCNFPDLQAELKSQMIQSCLSTRLRRRALRDDMTLDELLTLARGFELSDQQAHTIEHPSSRDETAQAVYRHSKPNYNRGGQKGRSEQNHDAPRSQPQRFKKKECYRCGGEYPHEGVCPAMGKTCSKCNRKDHYSKVCRSHSQKAYQVSMPEREISSSDDEYSFHVKGHNCSPKAEIVLNGTTIEMIVDTGATVNVLDESTFSSLKQQPNLTKTPKKLYPYGSDNPINIIGTFVTEIISQHQETSALATIYVVKGHFGSLLSYTTAVDLGIIPTIRVVSPPLCESIQDEFRDRFQGIGKIEGVQVKIHVDESVQPVVQQHRRIPFHLRKKVEAELERLEELDIIEKIDGPTPWVSPIVVAPKPKNPEEIRICVDMRLPNQAVQRERHITPTIDDIIVDLNGATVFSKLDLNAGYHQIELAPESRYITTFTTHVGLRRYKRLIFGISSASEIFQDTLRDCLEGLEGVKNISDDILVYAKDQESHDERLHAVMERLREKNITLNESKCEFNKDQVEFFGYVFSKKGVSPDPKKIDAIVNAEAPKTPADVRSLLGLANYVSRFIPDFATITAPLRALTHRDVEWRWGHSEKTSFQQLKEKLTTEAMAYFDVSKEIELLVDASPVGLGAILTQEGKIIQYASKSLSDVEKRYSQTEKEALAIVWGCEHFHLYLCGSPTFTLVTDHKPLETIFNNPNNKPPARIERWRLRLQPYDFIVKFRPGADNPADYMSRHPTASAGTFRHSKVAEEYLNFLVQHAVPKAMTLQEIVVETSKDVILQEVIEKITSSQWRSPFRNEEARQFVRIKDELSVASTPEGCVLMRNTQLVLPTALQQRAIDIAHEGHQGIVKTKQLLRQKVWFTGINDLVEKTCKKCIPCLASTPNVRQEPLHMTDLPDKPWTHVSADFCGPFPSGDYLLVVVDDYSRFPVVETLTKLTARSVIPKFDKIFSEYGIPVELKTDNGPPFQGSEFKNFANNLGFNHRKITPLWPRANGEAERFMRTLGKAVKTANVENLNWKQELYKFLRNYRATPHSSTGRSPAEALFSREIRTKLPEYTAKTKPAVDIRERDQESKRKMKVYADTKNRAQESNIGVGDHVLVKTKRENKLSTPFSPVPYEVVKQNGTCVTVRRGNHEITRNSSFFKKVEEGASSSGPEDDPGARSSGPEDDPDVDVADDDGPADDAPVDDATTNNANAPEVTVRDRPVRTRNRPRHLEDYV